MAVAEHICISIRRARARRPAWREIAAWYRSFDRPLGAFLLRATRSQADAEDLKQEAFLRLWHAHSHSHIDNPRAFLFTTAANLVKDRSRRAYTRMARTAVCVKDIDIPDFASEPSRIAESGQVFAQIVQTLAGLHPNTQKAFLLDRVQLHSQAEIAAQMCITVSMVEKHIRNAMTALERDGIVQPRRVFRSASRASDE